jgi:probable F420-dependent oxidoreductase
VARARGRHGIDGVTALTFGVVAGGGLDADRLARLEALPVDALWMGGHVASPNPSPEVMMALAVLAARTERVRVGTSILLLPLYAPAIVAKQIADLDNLTGGRVTLGVGVGGEYPGEFRACQVPVEERGPRTDEAIPLLRRFWTGEPVSHDGRFFAMDDVRIHPAPAQPGGPPIVVAGRQRPAMRRAALLGDGWMPYLYSPRRYAESVAIIRDEAARAGRTLERFEWCAFVFVALDPDRDRARDDAARFLGGTYRQDFRPMVDHVAAVGDVDEVTVSLQRFVDAGARHLIFAPASPDAPGTIERIFDEVVPRLRHDA